MGDYLETKSTMYSYLYFMKLTDSFC